MPNAKLLPGSLAVVFTLAGVHAGSGLEASAQTIRGRVLDEDRGAPISIAGVYLLDEARDVRARALADSAGRFVLRVPKSGRYYLAAQRIGHIDTESPLVIVSAEREYEVDLSLRPEPIRLDGLEVEVPLLRQNRWARDRLVYMDSKHWGSNPVEVLGFRLILGAPLEEAKLKSADALEMLRWAYVPIFNNLEGLCVEMRPEFDRRGGVSQRVCGTTFLDGIPIPPEHIEALDTRSINAVMIVPPEIHLMTVRFEQQFQERRGGE
jgi:hypothetical protein